MNRKFFPVSLALAAGFFFTLPALAQNTLPDPLRSGVSGGSPTPAFSSQAPKPPAQRARPGAPADIFAGLDLSGDEKAKVDKIRADTKAKLDKITADAATTADQKSALIEGYQRIERQQIFEALTPEHKAEVRKRMAALRAAKDAQKKSHPASGQAPRR